PTVSLYASSTLIKDGLPVTGPGAAHFAVVSTQRLPTLGARDFDVSGALDHDLVASRLPGNDRVQMVALGLKERHYGPVTVRLRRHVRGLSGGEICNRGEAYLTFYVVPFQLPVSYLGDWIDDHGTEFLGTNHGDVEFKDSYVNSSPVPMGFDGGEGFWAAHGGPGRPRKAERDRLWLEGYAEEKRGREVGTHDGGYVHRLGDVREVGHRPGERRYGYGTHRAEERAHGSPEHPGRSGHDFRGYSAPDYVHLGHVERDAYGAPHGLEFPSKLARGLKLSLGEEYS
ncbi:unnamed protein product, partial [Ostreobium quekettii]